MEVPLFMKNKIYPERNIYSILVGKNGSGKSTLLGNLAEELTKNLSKTRKQNEDVSNNFYNYEKEFPNEIIAVSTSPFDKFPLDRYNRQKYYTYLGLRDINSSTIGLGYLSKIISSLIDSISKNPKQAFEICNVLKFLNYRDVIDIIIDINFNVEHLFELLQKVNSFKELEDEMRNVHFPKIFNKQFFINSDDTFNERKLRKLNKIIAEIVHNYHRSRRFNISIFQYGFEKNDLPTDIENIIFLLEAGLFKLKDVLLNTVSNNERYSIKEASSGEQSIILSILGIASRIKDNSLILIDEPEICLHPHWQEKYMEILIHTFDKFRNCQFIIATHSPLIISKLSSSNSFIINLEEGRINSSENYINNSVDFQLVNVFNNPGFKNEYLLRIAISTFTKVSKYKKFDTQDVENLRILSDNLKHLRRDDPVYDLIYTLIKLGEKYGKNNFSN